MGNYSSERQNHLSSAVVEMENVIAFKARVGTLKEDIQDRLLTPFVLTLFLGADGNHRPAPRVLPSQGLFRHI